MTRRVSEDSQADSERSAVRRPPDEQTFIPGETFAVRKIVPPSAKRQPQPGRGRRSQTIAANQGGHYIRAAIPTGSVRDVAVDATLRAAALRFAQGSGGAGEQGRLQMDAPLPLYPPALLRVLATDLRVKIRRARTGNLILFVVDASGSMGARKRMMAVKGAVLSLLLDAYQKRDRVGLIAFRGQGAEILVPPTNSVELAEQRLRHLPTGGRTPLAAGLQLAERVLVNHLQRDAALTPLLVLVTDGRANVGPPGQLRQVAEGLAHKRLAALVLDSDQSFVRIGAARDLAAWLEAEYLPLDDLRAGVIAGRVRHSLQKARQFP